MGCLFLPATPAVIPPGPSPDSGRGHGSPPLCFLVDGLLCGQWTRAAGDNQFLRTAAVSSPAQAENARSHDRLVDGPGRRSHPAVDGCCCAVAAALWRVPAPSLQLGGIERAKRLVVRGPA